MNRRRIATTAGLAVLSLLAYAAALAVALPSAHAQGIPDCGGEGAMHTVPDGGFARCQGSRILQDGLRWSVIVEVRDDGTFGAQFTRPVAATADIFVELEAHKGGSGQGEVGALTGFLPAGQTQVTLAGQFNPADLVPFDCITQTDAKAINGNLDKPTPPNQNRVRIAGGWFRFEDCTAPVPTTTTAPATTVPGSSSPTTTAPTASPPSSGGRSTTVLPPSSVVGGTIPTTGLTEGQLNAAGLALFLVIPVGLFLIVVATRRSVS